MPSGPWCCRPAVTIYLVPPSVDVFLPIDDPKKQLKDKTVLRIEAVLNKLAVLKKIMSGKAKAQKDKNTQFNDPT